MFTATKDGQSVTWDNGEITGDAELVRRIEVFVGGGFGAAFDYWGMQDASLDDEFVAYITIGAALSDETGAPTFDTVPDNPDGYEPEGPKEIA